MASYFSVSCICLLRVQGESLPMPDYIPEFLSQYQNNHLLVPASAHWPISFFSFFFFFFFFFLVFQDKVSLYSPVCPRTHSVDQDGLELRNPPASAS